ncbi:MAG: terminase [Anaerosolibacter sp.]|jgi:phage terminase large subunit-like protein|uniref:terminase large subunit n=1 Tax=Anaerosolibacter sp. TaxID=1872527 RepID=UPI00261B41BF|nr:terminase TerL endonuclease subunit [Anaerosolibacter sp.]MDF2546136.1 terminase [Anaerosolibacter sp.]
MYLEAYYRKCKSGEIIVGKELMAQLEMCMGDITLNPNIRFNIEESDKRIKFIETKCKHFEAPHAGKPFLLELFQKAFIEALFAIQIYDEEIGRWVRKYQDVLFLVGRKNGKTPFIGAICLAEFFCGEMGTKILCSSNDYEQADLMFQAINSMREESASLEKVTKKNIKGIFFGNPKQKNKKGKFSKQNKGSIRKLSAKTGAKEGRNIRIGAVDEVFEMKDDSTVMPIRQALSTQDEPLYFELTTEGFTQDGYLDVRLIEARKVLKGESYRPRWLIWLYTQDSESEVWQDEASWTKSNPGLGKIKKVSFLRSMVEEAKESTSKRAFVLAKDFNIKQNNANAWLQEGQIINLATFELEKFRNMRYIGALDFAETTDLCNAKALFVDFATMKKYTATMYFIPESKADEVLSDENGTNPEKKDYRAWEKAGLVTIVPGSEVDAAYVVKWFYGLYEMYGMQPFKIGYDNWHAKDFKKLIADYFGEEVLERINMDFASLSNPMRIVEADLRDKNLIYNNNEVDAWCLRNTAYKTNNIGQIMPVKVMGQSKNRIDGALGFMIAYATYSRFKSEYLDLIR